MPFRDLISPLVSSKTLAYVLLLAVITGLYAIIPTWFEFNANNILTDVPSEFHGVLSLVLGWLLVFRTNTAYSRWWEARKHWGTLVNTCRNLAVKFRYLGTVSSERLERIDQLIIAFPVALRCHLRGEVDTKLPANVRSLVGGVRHVPLEIARQLYSLLNEAKEDQQLDGDDQRVLENDLQRLMDVCGACERILKTRIVRSYRIFARQCVMIFLGTLPWGIVHDFKLWTIPLTIIAAYFMLGLETVAEHVEEPFGYDEDDLDLESLCETIERSVEEVARHPDPSAAIR